MRPDSNQRQPVVRTPIREAGYSLVPSRPTPASSRNGGTQEATANIAREQIDAIYANDENTLMAVEAEPTSHDNSAPQPATAKAPQQQIQPTPDPVPSQPTYAYAPEPTDQTPSTDSTSPQILHSKRKFHTEQEQVPIEDLIAENPYDRSHDESNLKANDTEWKQYHTAWQNYYQQYFHRYYAGHIQQMQAELNAKGKASTKSSAAPSGPNPGDITPEQAMEDIRSSLRAKVRERAKKVRKSRHFMPVAAALSVMLVFAFLQYNRVLFSNINAYIVPSNLEPTNLIVDPASNTSVGPEPKLIIPRVNIDVPVVWNTRPDHDSQMRAMENGVAWFGIPGANSKPGQVGNTVLSGHSSNDFLETGDYKFVFAPLHRMSMGDTIYINYEGTRYTYTVTKIDVVNPTDVDSLRYSTDKPMLTLITCTPLGTALNRLLITAEQVLPDPGEAKPAPSSSNNESSEMPGIQPTVVERMFGAR